MSEEQTEQLPRIFLLPAGTRVNDGIPVRRNSPEEPRAAPWGAGSRRHSEMLEQPVRLARGPPACDGAAGPACRALTPAGHKAAFVSPPRRELMRAGAAEARSPGTGTHSGALWQRSLGAGPDQGCTSQREHCPAFPLRDPPCLQPRSEGTQGPNVGHGAAPLRGRASPPGPCAVLGAACARTGSAPCPSQTREAAISRANPASSYQNTRLKEFLVSF